MQGNLIFRRNTFNVGNYGPGAVIANRAPPGSTPMREGLQIYPFGTENER